MYIYNICIIYTYIHIYIYIYIHMCKDTNCTRHIQPNARLFLRRRLVDNGTRAPTLTCCSLLCGGAVRPYK